MDYNTPVQVPTKLTKVGVRQESPHSLLGSDPAAYSCTHRGEAERRMRVMTTRQAKSRPLTGVPRHRLRSLNPTGGLVLECESVQLVFKQCSQPRGVD